jgi:tetratricopeptide (TPR) repeat protein
MKKLILAAMKVVVYTLCLVMYFHSWSQDIPEGEFFRRMDRGEQLMKEGNYEAANVEFMYILENKNTIPTDLAYLFGRNSYHLNNYKQSINWLNKYIQIKGTKGRYYDAAVKFLSYAEDQYREIQMAKTASLAAELVNEDYDCGGLEKMICPVCHGSGVIIKRNYFGDEYRTCPYSAGEAYLSCEDYNLFMQGLLEPKLKN